MCLPLERRCVNELPSSPPALSRGAAWPGPAAVSGLAHDISVSGGRGGQLDGIGCGRAGRIANGAGRGHGALALWRAGAPDLRTEQVVREVREQRGDLLGSL